MKKAQVLFANNIEQIYKASEKYWDTSSYFEWILVLILNTQLSQ